MGIYTIEGAGANLVTAEGDGTYSHPAEAGGTWNGFDVPHANYRELLAYSEAVLEAGNRWTFRPVYIPEGDTHLLLLHFPCEDSTCTPITDGDYVDLGNGEHAHHDESYEYEVASEEDRVHVDGLMWERVEVDDQESEDAR